MPFAYPRRAEAIRSVDGGDKGERRQPADSGYGHQPPAGLRRARQTPYLRYPDLKDAKAVIEALN
jgi:hypothetical protein